jgi:hypothetical protein
MRRDQARAAGLSDGAFQGKMAAMLALAPQPEHSPPSEPRYQPLVIVLAAVAAGVMADRFAPLPLGLWWALAAAGLTIWAAPRVLGKTGLPQSGWKLLGSNLAVLLAVAATAAAWHHRRVGDLAATEVRSSSTDAFGLVPSSAEGRLNRLFARIEIGLKPPSGEPPSFCGGRPQRKSGSSIRRSDGSGSLVGACSKYFSR